MPAIKLVHLFQSALKTHVIPVKTSFKRALIGAD
jgi:hypothetical protein